MTNAHNNEEPRVNDQRFPPGLLGEVATWVMASSAYPNEDIALVTAIALLSTLTGRAYCTPTGAGLNQYILLLAQTGMGKEAIASAIGKLFAAVIADGIEIAGTFKGPSHIASVQALIKWLAKAPAIICILGEFGQKLKAMAKNPSPNDTALLAGYLEIYSKSGAGAVVDAMAYSDKDKNTETIVRPALTLVGETVPDVFYNLLDAGMISNGLLPRFCVFEVTGIRPYLNPAPSHMPPAFLIAKLKDLIANCLNLGRNAQPQVVKINDDAKSLFDDFERWTTDQINQSQSDVVRQLWNRAYLKAIKLASIWAIGWNYLFPYIDMASAIWATDLVASQTKKLIAKFENNEVGPVDGNESKQRTTVLRLTAEYNNSKFADIQKYGVNEALHKRLIITHSYLSRRILSLPAFANDRLGATAALKRTITRMVEDYELVEVPPKQLAEMFNTKAKAYIVSTPEPFWEVNKC